MEFFTVFYMLVILAISGMLAGLLAGLLGVGGGIIFVPALYFLFSKINIPESFVVNMAAATSLAIILPTAISSSIKHRANNNIDYSLIKLWIIPLFLGILLGIISMPYIPNTALKLVFATVLVIAALRFLSNKLIEKITIKSLSNKYKASLGFLPSCISSIIGVGGGIFFVPILTVINYPIKLAIGTSALLTVIVALISTVFYIGFGLLYNVAQPYSLGYVFIPGLLIMCPFSIIFSRIGASLVPRVNVNILQFMFAFLLLFEALIIVLKI